MTNIITGKKWFPKNAEGETFSAQPVIILDQQGEHITSFGGEGGTVEAVVEGIVEATLPDGVDVNNFPEFATEATLLIVNTEQQTQTAELQSIANSNIIIQSKLMPVGLETSYLGDSYSANLSTSEGKVFSIICTNLSSTLIYFQLFNTTIVSAGDIPYRSFPVLPNAGTLMLGQDLLGGSGINFTNAISWAVSSTPVIYTELDQVNIEAPLLTIRWSQ